MYGYTPNRSSLPDKPFLRTNTSPPPPQWRARCGGKKKSAHWALHQQLTLVRQSWKSFIRQAYNFRSAIRPEKQ